MHEKSVFGAVFDLDNTLVRSEEFYDYCLFTVLETVLNSADVSYIKQELEKYRGGTSEQLWKLIEKRCQHSKVCLQDRYNNLVHRTILDSQMVSLMTESVNFAERLSNHGFKLAIATSSSRFIAFALLKRFDLSRLFPVIVTGDDVSNNKPNPEIYQLAVSRIGIKPQNCIAIEDSVNGIISASKAGCKTYSLINFGSSLIDDINTFFAGDLSLITIKNIINNFKPE